MSINQNLLSVNRPVIYSCNEIGYDIMVIYEPDGYLSYIMTTRHVPTTSSSIESIDFLIVEGIDMNDFMFSNQTTQFRDNNASFNNALVAYLQKHQGRTRKYHKDIRWTLYLAYK